MKYTRLAQDNLNEGETLPNRSKSKTRSYLGVGALFGIVALIVYWAFQRMKTNLEKVDNAPSNGQKDLVIASYQAQDVSWLSEVPYEWTIKRYLMDDPNPDPSVGLSVPQNFGREAMAYLTYIVDHYDNLPDFAMFIHGHYQSWHQPIPIPKTIRALNITSLTREKYISLRCGNQMGCERRPYIDTYHVNWQGEEYIREFWETIVPQQEMPRYISFKCCAQFAVSRQAIRARTRDEWIRIRQPLLRSHQELKESEVWAKGYDDVQWKVGTLYEKVWHLIFGVDPEACPGKDQCHMEFFSNAIVCANDLDLTPYDGDIWKENVCKTAFDNIGRDDEVDWTDWNQKILGYSADVRIERNRILEEERQRVRVADGRLDHAKRHISVQS